MWDHRPERVPGFSPSRLPAWLKSWQGNPPVRMSIGSTVDQSIFVRSPRFGACGIRWAMILHAPVSMSEVHTVSALKNDSTAMSSPP